MKSSSRPSSGVATPRDDDPLEFEILPETGLKGSSVEFWLGTPINQVITHIQQNSSVLQKVRLTYPKMDPLEKEICIYLQNEGIKLHFDNVSQLLNLIEIVSFDNIVLKYKDRVVSDPSTEVGNEKIDDCFGSTHAPEYDERRKLCVKTYRGLCFYLKIPSTGSLEVNHGRGAPNLSSLRIDSSVNTLHAMHIFKGTTIADIAAIEMPNVVYCGQNFTTLVEADQKDGRIDGVRVRFKTQGKIEGAADTGYEIIDMEAAVRFGDSVARVLMILGAPSKVYWKSEDKMSIHRGDDRQSAVPGPAPHFFFNYFSMGLDILFHYATKRVIKVVLHTNMPGHYDFGIYHRCPFEIKLIKSGERHTIAHNSKLEDLTSIFLDEGEPAKPVVISRTSHEQKDPFGATYCYGTEQLVVEVMDNGYIAAVTLYSYGI